MLKEKTVYSENLVKLVQKSMNQVSGNFVDEQVKFQDLKAKLDEKD